MEKNRIKEILDGFKDLKIAVVGDFVLDQYFVIDTRLNEPSLETPHEAYQVVSTRKYPGACGTVTNNLAALGVGEVFAVTFIGDDGTGYELERELKARRIKLDYMIRTGDMITPTYVKPMMWSGDEEEESNRLDIKNFKNTPESLEKEILGRLDDVFSRCDAVIILDQMVESNCGVITDRVRKRLIELGGMYEDKIIFADSRSKIHMFDKMSVKCNNYEVCRAFHPDIDEKPDMETTLLCGSALYEKNSHPVFVTMGPDGITTFGEHGTVVVPTEDVPGPYDICGAGDSVAAAVVSSLASGADEVEAAFMGNLAAGVTIRKIGRTGTASPEEILKTHDGWFRGTKPWRR